MFKNKFTPILVLSVCCSFTGHVFAQAPSWTFDLLGKEKKPEQFETRRLASEKTGEKKFKAPRHFIQNLVSRDNFYFNANNKLNSVVEKAKLSAQDDYSKLLPYYAYTLDNTASQKSELDSVIYKCTAGILLHDLRTDWVDNFYLLIGKSYLLRKDMDSAVMTFQFINYNLFPRKKHEDDNRIVGTRDDAASGAISIANPEKRNIIQRTFSMAPSRNESLIWLVRSLIEQEEYSEAGGIINTLQNDPNMPKRLMPFLDEVDAYWFFRQGIYDSAAVHLEKALDNAETKQDRSRWEFLLAQMFELSHQFDKASDYYDKAAKHTTDPLMDIFARLNDAKMLRTNGNSKELDANIDKLVHMAKKDKFESYRDIIFYSAGDIALQKPDTIAAIGFFNKSLKYNENNTPYKNKTFMKLSDIAYAQKKYKLAYAMYDSLQVSDSTLKDRMDEILAKRTALGKIVEKIDIIDREDSLQRIAGMSPTDREAFIKKELRRLRKENGLKDDDNSSNSGSQPITFNNPNAPAPDLFSNNTKGEWYFYNNSAKSRGFTDFKSKWGVRSNVDNWRRKSASGQSINTPVPAVNNPNMPALPAGTKKGALNGSNTPPAELTYEELLKNVPLTPEKMSASNDLLAQSLFELGKLYQDELEDYAQAIETYEECLQRFPTVLYDGDLYYNLYFCYNKLGFASKAAFYKNLLLNKFPNSKPGKTVANPNAFDPKSQNPAATKQYSDIYNLFIEGKFEEAIAQKKEADSKYGQNYWTPQLLYIEAVYQVKQKNDSAARTVLQNIISIYPNAPLAARAKNLLEVLSHRKEIEDYLNALQITRMEDENVKVDDKVAAVTTAPVVSKPAIKPVIDTVKKSAVPVPTTNGTFVLAPSAPNHVVILMDKIDPVYVNEAKNAFERYNRENFYSTPITTTKDAIDNDIKLLVFSGFINAEAAIQYMDKARRAAPSEVSWLPVAKYSFIIITEENLQLLKTNKDIQGYKKLLNTQYPGKF